MSRDIMVRTATSVSIWTVLCLVYLVPGSESLGADECPDVVDYGTKGQYRVAYITASGPPRKGRLEFEFKFRVPLFEDTGGTIELLGDRSYNSYAATHEGDLKYLVEFRFKDIIPIIVAITLNGKLVCSAFDEMAYGTNLVTWTHFASFYIDEKGSYYADPATTRRPSSPTRPRERKPTSPPPVIVDQEETYECGIPRPKLTTLVVRGEEVVRGDWPWSVPLFHLPGLTFECSGTIVSRRHVITAAHCVMRDGFEMDPSDVKLKVGAHNLGRFKEAHARITHLRSIVVHDEYDHNTKTNDLAVLTTRKPILYSEYVRPICLWEGDSDQSQVINRLAVVTGWGKTETDSISPTPREIIVPIVSLDDCRKSHSLFNQLAVGKTLCAGSRDKRGPCNGDSGAGLYVNDGRRWQLRALVSASVDLLHDCDLNHFVLYTDLAQYADWIQSQMQ